MPNVFDTEEPQKKPLAPEDDLFAGTVDDDPVTRVRSIAAQRKIPADVADDYLKLTKGAESGNRQYNSSGGTLTGPVTKGGSHALGMGQVMPDQKGGYIRTINGEKFDLRDPEQNVAAGLSYFHSGGSDPVARRLYYFGGPKARDHYLRTGQIPEGGDGYTSFKEYVRKSGARLTPKPGAPEDDLFAGAITDSPPSAVPENDLMAGAPASNGKSAVVTLSPRQRAQAAMARANSQQPPPDRSGIAMGTGASAGRGYELIPRDPNYPNETAEQTKRRLEMNETFQKGRTPEDYRDPTAAQFPVGPTGRPGNDGYGTGYNKSALDVGYVPPGQQPRELPRQGALPGMVHLNPAIAPKVPNGAPRPFAPGEWVDNPDGSWSSEISSTIENADGSWSVVPGMWLVNGQPQRVDEDTASRYAQTSGLTFPKYKTLGEAEKFATDRESVWQGVKPQEASKIAPLWSAPLAPANYLTNATEPNGSGIKPETQPAPVGSSFYGLEQLGVTERTNFETQGKSIVDPVFGEGTWEKSKAYSQADRVKLANVAQTEAQNKDLLTRVHGPGVWEQSFNLPTADRAKFIEDAKNVAKIKEIQDLGQQFSRQAAEESRQRQAQQQRVKARASIARAVAKSIQQDPDTGNYFFDDPRTRTRVFGSSREDINTQLAQRGYGVRVPEPKIGTPAAIAEKAGATPAFFMQSPEEVAQAVATETIRAEPFRQGPGLAPLEDRTSRALAEQGFVTPQIAIAVAPDEAEGIRAQIRSELSRNIVNPAKMSTADRNQLESEVSGRAASQIREIETARSQALEAQQRQAKIDPAKAKDLLHGIFSKTPAWAALPENARTWVQEWTANTGGSWIGKAAGLIRNGVPSLAVAKAFGAPDVVLGPTANFLQSTSDQIHDITAVVDKHADRSNGSQMALNIASGFTASAPELALIALGVPAAAAFGIGGAAEAQGHNATFAQTIAQGTQNAAIGALFQLPVPTKLQMLQGIAGNLSRMGFRMGTVGVGTYAITGDPQAAAVNALLAGSGEGLGILKAGGKAATGAAARGVVESNLPPDWLKSRVAESGGYQHIVLREVKPLESDQALTQPGEAVPGEPTGRALSAYRDPSVPEQHKVGGTEIDASKTPSYEARGIKVIDVTPEAYETALRQVNSINPTEPAQISAPPPTQPQISETASPRSTPPLPRSVEELSAPERAQEARAAKERATAKAPAAITEPKQSALDALDRAVKANAADDIRNLSTLAAERGASMEEIKAIVSQPEPREIEYKASDGSVRKATIQPMTAADTANLVAADADPSKFSKVQNEDGSLAYVETAGLKEPAKSSDEKVSALEPKHSQRTDLSEIPASRTNPPAITAARKSAVEVPPVEAAPLTASTPRKAVEAYMDERGVSIEEITSDADTRQGRDITFETAEEIERLTGLPAQDVESVLYEIRKEARPSEVDDLPAKIATRAASTPSEGGVSVPPKQPWEMTRAEFEKVYRENPKGSYYSVYDIPDAEWETFTPFRKFRENVKQVVKDAPTVLKELSVAAKHKLLGQYQYPKELQEDLASIKGESSVARGSTVITTPSLADLGLDLPIKTTGGVTNYEPPPFSDFIKLRVRANQAYQEGNVSLGDALENLRDQLAVASESGTKPVSFVYSSSRVGGEMAEVLAHERTHEAFGRREVIGDQADNLFNAPEWKELRSAIDTRKSWDRISVDPADNIGLAHELLAYGLTGRYGEYIGQLAAPRSVVRAALKQAIIAIHEAHGGEGIDDIARFATRSARRFVRNAIPSAQVGAERGPLRAESQQPSSSVPREWREGTGRSSRRSYSTRETAERDWERIHRESVERAIAEGKIVPSHVLAEYPQFKSPSAAPQEAPKGETGKVGLRREFALAAEGLISYRYRPDKGGHVAIGAKNNAEALSEAARSISGKPDIANLDVWDGEKYVPVEAPKTAETKVDKSGPKLPITHAVSESIAETPAKEVAPPERIKSWTNARVGDVVEHEGAYVEVAGLPMKQGKAGKVAERSGGQVVPIGSKFAVVKPTKYAPPKSGENITQTITEDARTAETKAVTEAPPSGSTKEMKPFPSEMKSLGIPRAAMPQVDLGHRGAMVQYLKGRGVDWDNEEIAPSRLRPSQAEYNPEKVEKARNWVGPERRILISDDDRVLDGHHQWLRKLEDAPNDPIPVIRLHQDAQTLLMEMREFPSSWTDGTHHEAEPTEESEPRKFSSTQVQITGEAADLLRAAQRKIDPKDLQPAAMGGNAATGVEDDLHVTVKYGVHSESPKGVRSALKGEEPITAKFGKVDVFEGIENGTADAVIVNIESPDLHRLNKAIADNVEVTDTYPEYKPHATLAYVKPGTGKKYKGMDAGLEGQPLSFDTVVFSSKDYTTTAIPLEGETAHVSEQRSGTRTEGTNETERGTQALEEKQKPNRRPEMDGVSLPEERQPEAEEAVAEGLTLAEIKRRLPIGYDSESVRIVDGRIMATEKHYGHKTFWVSLKGATAKALTPEEEERYAGNEGQVQFEGGSPDRSYQGERTGEGTVGEGSGAPSVRTSPKPKKEQAAKQAPVEAASGSSEDLTAKINGWAERVALLAGRVERGEIAPENLEVLKNIYSEGEKYLEQAKGADSKKVLEFRQALDVLAAALGRSGVVIDEEVPVALAVTPAIQQAFNDWNSNRAYVDKGGNYRVRPEPATPTHKMSGPVASWNKEAKRRFPTSAELHAAAKASVGETPAGKKLTSPSLTTTTVAESPKPAIVLTETQRKAHGQKPEKVNRAGFTKTQADSIARQTEEYAHALLIKAYGEEEATRLLKEYEGEMPVHTLALSGEPETIKVPSDGEFKISSAEQANRLHQKATGQPIEGFARAKNAGVSIGTPRGREPSITPSINLDDLIAAYGGDEQRTMDVLKRTMPTEEGFQEGKSQSEYQGEAAQQQLIDQLQQRWDDKRDPEEVKAPFIRQVNDLIESQHEYKDLRHDVIKSRVSSGFVKRNPEFKEEAKTRAEALSPEEILTYDVADPKSVVGKRILFQQRSIWDRTELPREYRTRTNGGIDWFRIEAEAKEGNGKFTPEPETKADADPQRDPLIEKIVAAARRQKDQLQIPVKRYTVIGSDGKSHSGDLPAGVSVVERDKEYWVSQSAKQGTTHGKRYDSREEWQKAHDAQLDLHDEDFRKELVEMSSERLKSQADYWLPKEEVESLAVEEWQQPQAATAKEQKPEGVTLESTYKRKTPAPSTPERAASEQARVEFDQKTKEFSEQESEFKEKAQHSKYGSQVRDRWERKAKKADEQLNQVYKDYEAQRKQWRTENLEDVIVEGDEANSLSALALLTEDSTGLYEKVKALAIKEAEKQGATTEEAENAAISASSMVMNYPGLNRPMAEQIKTELRVARQNQRIADARATVEALPDLTGKSDYYRRIDQTYGAPEDIERIVTSAKEADEAARYAVEQREQAETAERDRIRDSLNPLDQMQLSTRGAIEESVATGPKYAGSGHMLFIAGNLKPKVIEKLRAKPAAKQYDDEMTEKVFGRALELTPDESSRATVLGVFPEQSSNGMYHAFVRNQTDTVAVDAAKLLWIDKNVDYDEIRAAKRGEKLVQVNFYKDGEPVGVLAGLNLKDKELPSEPVEEAASATKPEKETKEETAPFVDVGEKIGGARKDLAERGFIKGDKREASEEPGWRKRFQVSEIVKSTKEGEIGKWSVIDTRKKDWSGQPIQLPTLFDSKEDAEESIPLAAVALKHVAYQNRKAKSDDLTTYGIYRKVADRKIVRVVPDDFPDREEAMKYMAIHPVEILDTKTSFGEEILPVPEAVVRKGIARRASDATPQMLKDQFGFRAVEFGNWNNQLERQEVVNHAYDSLADLAAILNIPPAAIGLNGELALAFGARGHGLSSARAHYEPAYGAMNLTKMKGAGSLAHEWFHALDHYFGRVSGKAKTERVVNKRGDEVFPVAPGGFYQVAVTHGFPRESKARPEIKDAYDELVRTMFKKAQTYVEDSNRAEKFVGETRKNLEDKLRIIRDTGYVALSKDVPYGKKNKAAAAEQLAAWDTVAQKMLDGEFVETKFQAIPGSKSQVGGRWTNEGLEKLSEVYKTVRGRSGFNTEQEGPLDDVRRALHLYDQRLKMLASAQSGEEKVKQVPTEFAMEAKSIDEGRTGEYWLTTHEMAARAFQAYVEDRLAEQGGQNDFLSYGTHSVVPTPWGWRRPFPHGEERTAINQAFDKLVNTLQTKETDKGTALYAKDESKNVSLLDGGVPEFSVEGNLIVLENRAAAELLALAMKQPPGSIGGMFVEHPERTGNFGILQTGLLAIKYQPLLAPANRMAQMLVDILSEHRSVRIAIPSRIPHETTHQFSYDASGEKPIEKRHSTEGVRMLTSIPEWETMLPGLQSRYGVRPDAYLIEEALAALAGGQYQSLGLSIEGAREWSKAWAKSFAASNGDAILKYFEETNDESKRIREESASDLGRPGTGQAVISGSEGRERPETDGDTDATPQLELHDEPSNNRPSAGSERERDDEGVYSRDKSATDRRTLSGTKGRDGAASEQAGAIRQTDTPEFKRWFGESKVVDENDEPLVVYHSTQKDFVVFDENKQSGYGLHFGTPEQATMRTAGEGKNLMPSYLRIDNPRRSKDTGMSWKSQIRAAKSAGHDGVIYLNRFEGIPREAFERATNELATKHKTNPNNVDFSKLSDEEFRKLLPEARDSYIVFKPEQIKSATDNAGTFDPSNPNILFSREEDPWTEVRRAAEELQRPEGEKRRRLPLTFEAAGMEKGTELFYGPQSILSGIERAKQIVADKGVEGAAEFVLSGAPGIEWAATGYEVLAQMRAQANAQRTTDLAEAERLDEKRLNFLNEFVGRSTKLGQAIAGVNAIAEYAPDRAAYILNRTSLKNRGRGISQEEEAKINDLAEKLAASMDANKSLEQQIAYRIQIARELEDELAAAEQRARRREKYKPGEERERPMQQYEVKLDDQSASLKDELMAKIGNFNFGNLKVEARFPDQQGKVGENIAALPGDAELLAQYAAGLLSKLNTVAELNEHMLSTFGNELESVLSAIRQRAFQIRKNARTAELAAKDTGEERRRTIIGEIQAEISASRRAVRDLENAHVAAEKERKKAEETAQREAQATAKKAQKAAETANQRQIRQEAREAASKARKEERVQRLAEIKEARVRAAEVKKEYAEASKAETKGWRGTIKEQKQAARTAALWDTPIRNEAAAARERLAAADATMLNDPGVMEDLVSVAAAKFLPDKPGGNVRTKAVDPSRLYLDLKDEFPGLVTKKNQREIYRRSYQRIQDTLTASREAARLRSASKESKALWEKMGLDSDAQALLIQRAKNQREQRELRQKMQAEFRRVSRTRVGTIVMELGSLPRALQSSIDAPLGRQGIILAMLHPVETLTNTVPATVKGYTSDIATPRHLLQLLLHPQETWETKPWRQGEFQELVLDLESHPEFETAHLAELDLPTVMTDADRRIMAEEDFQSAWGEKFPHVRLSEQGFILGMNTARLTAFARIASLGRANGYTWENNPTFFRQAAAFINAATGRANMPDLVKRMSSLTNLLFYSTRLNISRMQVFNQFFNPIKYLPAKREGKSLFGVPIYNPLDSTGGGIGGGGGVDIPVGGFADDGGGFGGRGLRTFDSHDPVMRRVMVGELLRGLAVVLGFYLLCKLLGLSIELNDLDSANWGKLRWGNTRYDITGGHAATLRFLLRFTRGVYQQLTSNKKDMDPKHDPWAIFKEFAKYKFAPWASTGYAALYGEDVIGQPANFKLNQGFSKTMQENILIKMIEPMVFGDFADGMVTDGWIGTAKTLPALTGMGVQTYPFKDKPGESEAQKLLRVRRSDLGYGNDEPEDKERRLLVRQLEDDARAGKKIDSQVDEGIKTGKLKPDDKKLIEQDSALDQWQLDFKRASVRDALDAYEKASPEDRTAVKAILIDKGPAIQKMRVTEQKKAYDDFKRLTGEAARTHEIRRGPNYYKTAPAPSPTP